MIDIDNFKKLNDGFGHDFGDEVLRGVAQLLLSNEGRNAKCYRYGGEEMVIILEHFDLERAVRFSEHVRTEISGLKWRKDVHVTANNISLNAVLIFEIPYPTECKPRFTNEMPLLLAFC